MTRALEAANPNSTAVSTAASSSSRAYRPLVGPTSRPHGIRAAARDPRITLYLRAGVYR